MMLLGVVGPAVTRAVARRQVVDQDLVLLGFAQGTQEAGRTVASRSTTSCRVCVGGADGDTEAGSELADTNPLTRSVATLKELSGSAVQLGVSARHIAGCGRRKSALPACHGPGLIDGVWRSWSIRQWTA